MTVFNVLDRHQAVHRHALLEASAGTGKTFAIENVVVRLLIESHEESLPLTIDKILIVTFTRAATRDLKERIRANLEKALHIFKCFLSGQSMASGCPDYLKMHLEKGFENVKAAKRLVEQALFAFDEAQIFTIHGFCWRMLKNYALEGGLSLETSCREEQPLLASVLLQVVRDFLRTELHTDAYSTEQLRILLKRAGGEIDKLQTSLLDVVSRGIDILAPPTFSALFVQFQRAMHKLKQEHLLEGAKIIADFILQAPNYKELCDRSKQIKPVVMEKIQCFAALFDRNAWTTEDFELLIRDGVFVVEALDASRLLQRTKAIDPKEIHYPLLVETLQQTLGGIVEQASNETALFARLASDCQHFVRRYQEEEELLGHNDLLFKMKEALKHPLFAARVRQAYRAAIVDEFQDTDPIQWEIFETLFALSKEVWPGYLYLVGDPKQSIYAFRQADIYTYLAAAERLGAKAWATLDTNFRSQPKLVSALNVLFSAVPGLFPLPRLNQDLPYRHVHAGKSDHRPFRDSEACLHFWVAQTQESKKLSAKEYEEQFFFPAITKELVRLDAEEGVGFGQCAILVSDRYQAERLSRFLKAHHLPVKTQKGDELAKSPAVEMMREVIQGILYYRRPSALKLALSCRVIGMTHAELLGIESEEERLASIMQQCEWLRQMLFDGGFGRFYTAFMQTSWHAHGLCVTECLLQQVGGDEFYCQWQDVAELLIAEEVVRNLSPEGLIAFLDEFEVLASYDDERMKCYLDLEEDGVSVLTTHISKGLEFDVVFALGMMTRPKSTEKKLILIKQDKDQYLGAATHSDAAYLQHCQEIDAEKMRQLYVAFTRAKYRLYLPVVAQEENSDLPLGTASPMELLLARLEKPISNYQDVYQSIGTFDVECFKQFVAKHCTLMQLHMLPAAGANQGSRQSSPAPCLLLPPTVVVPGGVCCMQSFTSLSQGKHTLSLEPDETARAPHEFAIEIKSPHTLPSGNATGTLLHYILETIPFHCVKEMSTWTELVPLIQPMLDDTEFMGWRDVLAKIVYDALTVPFPGVDHRFCLADVDPKRIYRETEFLFPCDENSLFEEVPVRKGYLKGVIDLFFEHAGKYYLLDWKSNWLGPTLEYYTASHLQKAMAANQYDLQAKLYMEALQRYLKIFNLPFETVFGGTFYCFLRGLSPNAGIWRN